MYISGLITTCADIVNELKGDDLQELLETINEFVTIDGSKEFSAEIFNYNGNDRGIKILFKDTVYQIFEDNLS